MKIMTRSILLIAALLLCGGALNSVQANKFFGDGTMPDFIQDFAAADGEPGLSEEERQALKAALEEKREEFLAAIDADGDGNISPLEALAMLEEIRARIQERRRARFDEANTNNTGDSENCIDKDEFLALPGMDLIPAEVSDAIFAHLAGDDDCISLEEFLRVLPPVGPPTIPSIP